MKKRYLLPIVITSYAIGNYSSLFKSQEHKDGATGRESNEVRLDSRQPKLSGKASIDPQRKRHTSEGILSQLDFLKLENVPQGDAYAMVHHLLMKQIEKDPSVAYQWMLDNEDRFSQEDFSNFKKDILTTWGHSDPESAGALLVTLETEAYRDNLARALAKGWADKNVDQALDWLENLDGLSVSKDVLVDSYGIIMRKHAEIDPEATADIVSAMSSESLQYDLLHSTTTEYAKKDYPAALSWVFSLESKQVRSDGVRELMNMEDDGNRLHLLNEVVSSEADLSAGVVENAFAALGALSPVEAAARVIDIAPNRQPEMVTALVTSWAEADISAAETWVSSLPSGSNFEAGVTSIVDIISYKNPIKALAWTEKISPPDKRADLMVSVINSSRDSDLNDIQNHLASVDIPPNHSEAIKAALDERMANAHTDLVIPAGKSPAQY